MLNTETALFTAQDALVQGKFAHLQALLNLYQALGGGWHSQEPHDGLQRHGGRHRRWLWAH